MFSMRRLGIKLTSLAGGSRTLIEPTSFPPLSAGPVSTQAGDDTITITAVNVFGAFGPYGPTSELTQRTERKAASTAGPLTLRFHNSTGVAGNCTARRLGRAAHLYSDRAALEAKTGGLLWCWSIALAIGYAASFIVQRVRIAGPENRMWVHAKRFRQFLHRVVVRRGFTVAALNGPNRGCCDSRLFRKSSRGHAAPFAGNFELHPHCVQLSHHIVLIVLYGNCRRCSFGWGGRPCSLFGPNHTSLFGCLTSNSAQFARYSSAIRSYYATKCNEYCIKHNTVLSSRAWAGAARLVKWVIVGAKGDYYAIGTVRTIRTIRATSISRFGGCTRATPALC